jgi:hypothetical protein
LALQAPCLFGVIPPESLVHSLCRLSRMLLGLCLGTRCRFLLDGAELLLVPSL